MTTVYEINIHWALSLLRPGEEYGFNPVILAPHSFDFGYSMADIDWRAGTPPPTNEELVKYFTDHEHEYLDALEQEDWFYLDYTQYEKDAPEMTLREKVEVLERILDRIFAEINPSAPNPGN